jgi:hypothetical protein
MNFVSTPFISKRSCAFSATSGIVVKMIVAKTGVRMQFAFATLGLRPCRGRNFDSLTWRLVTDLQ